MHTHIQKHRHFLAAPLGIFLLLSSLGGSVVQASLVQTSEGSPSVLLLASHTQIQPSQEAVYEHSDDSFSLEEGAALVQTEGLATISVGESTVQALGGSFYLARYPSALSIAALTAPVLVRSQTAVLLIPTGWQWRGDATGDLQEELQQIPNDFLREQLAELHLLPSMTGSLPEALEHESNDVSWSLPSFLQMESAEERQEREWNESILGAVRFACEAGDSARLQELLINPAYASLFQSRRAVEVLAVLVTRYHDQSALALPLLTVLTQKIDLRLLASVHPHFRDSVWTLPDIEDQEGSVYKMLLWSMIASDSETEAISDFTMDRWKSAVMRFTKSLKAPASFLDETVHRLVPFVELFSRQGYPLRAERLSHALSSLIDPYRPLLSVETTQVVDRTRYKEARVVSGEENAGEADVLPAEVENNVPEAEQAFDPAQIEYMAYSDLRDVGALFTLETVLTAISTHQVDVDGIIFAGATKDILLNFIYDTQSKEVQDISFDGKEYPFATPIITFTDWIRGL